MSTSEMYYLIGIVKLLTIMAAKAERWSSSSHQLTCDDVPEPMCVGSRLKVASG